MPGFQIFMDEEVDDQRTTAVAPFGQNQNMNIPAKFDQPQKNVGMAIREAPKPVFRPQASTFGFSSESEATLCADQREYLSNVFNRPIHLIESQPSRSGLSNKENEEEPELPDFPELLKPNFLVGDDTTSTAVHDETVENSVHEVSVINAPCSESFTLPEVDEYLSEIFGHMKRQQVCYSPLLNYMAVQPDIDMKCRHIMTDWLVEVMYEYNLELETLCLAISHIDRFLSKVVLTRQKLQCLGATAIWVAAKYEEVYPPKSTTFSYITAGAFEHPELIKMEAALLKALNYCVTPITPIAWLTSIFHASKSCKLVRDMSHFCAVSLVVRGDLALRYEPSEIGAASFVYAQLCTRDETDPAKLWPSNLQKITGLSFAGFSPLLLFLHDTLDLHTTSDLQAVASLFSQSSFSSVSLDVERPSRASIMDLL